MIKGCQKKIIHIKNTNSPYFEEAYFILKEGCDELTMDNDMLKEAMRIAKGTKISSSVKRSKTKKDFITVLMISAAVLATIGVVLTAVALLC